MRSTSLAVFHVCWSATTSKQVSRGINSRYGDPILNDTYKELAEHYHTALLPVRVLAPRNKAAVEGTVGDLTTSIIAKLRNDTFPTLRDLNRAIVRRLRAFNERPFERREGSRSSVFQEEEISFLQPLPPLGRKDWSCYQGSHRGAPACLRD